MRFIKNNIKFLIVMILVITLGIFGITYALKIATFNPIVLNTTTGTINANITYDSTNTSTVTSTGNMLPISDTLVTGVDVTDSRILKIKFMVSGVSSNPSNTIYDIALRDISMSSALKSKYVKWRLYKNGTLLSEGNFSPSFDTIENNRLVLTNTQQDLTTSTDTYVYLMWISESCSEELSTCDITKSQDKLKGKTFSASIKIEASTKSKKNLTRTVVPANSASNKITNMFTPDTLVENNSIKYRYDTTNNLMEDIDGNIRYYGANPNNYIYFNCNNYSNQTSSTCETWRIIGVFDGKVKIMRNESIGDYFWDNNGKNNWSDARLMKMLNAGYESETGGSLYWNRQSGTCYSGTTADTTKTCDMSSVGLKNDITRNMISESTYSLLGWNNGSIYSDQIYNYERTTGSVYNETTRDKSWTGKVALAYPSDYGYATDLNQCSQTLYDYDNSTCKSNDWMFNSAYQWLLTPSSDNSYYVWDVYSSGYLNRNGASCEFGVRPVLFLGSELGIKAGDGSSSAPYQLSA